MAMKTMSMIQLADLGLQILLLILMVLQLKCLLEALSVGELLELLVMVPLATVLFVLLEFVIFSVKVLFFAPFGFSRWVGGHLSILTIMNSWTTRS
jgi:hypothetical protein